MTVSVARSVKIIQTDVFASAMSVANYSLSASAVKNAKNIHVCADVLDVTDCQTNAYVVCVAIDSHLYADAPIAMNY